MRACASTHIRVPAKVMLSGEYAVLFGGRSVAMAFDRYMKIKVKPRRDEQLMIDSDLWDAPIVADPRHPKLQKSPLGRVIEWLHQQDRCPAADVIIRSELKPEDGFGSSSAVSLGCLLALYLACEPQLLKTLPYEQNLGQFDVIWKLARLCWQQQKRRQPAASGYDFLSQSLGGVTILTPDELQWPGQYQRFAANPLRGLPMRIFKGGRGAPTGPIMSDTLTWISTSNRKHEIVQASEDFTNRLKTQLFHDDSSPCCPTADFYGSCGRFRRVFFHSPHYPHELLDRLEKLDGCDKSWSFKTTGAGGEDAVLLFGEPTALEAPEQYLRESGWSPVPHQLDSTGIALMD